MFILRKLIATASRSVKETSRVRTYSSLSKNVRKSVFISQSTDIFTNLALEHWLYRNYDFSNHHVLLLWQNDPCVVLGRHQNPWLECNVPMADKWGIALARRNSGGGTVYHDNGNLNLTFFVPREQYNRKYNLGIIQNTLYRHWGLTSIINKREDIVVDGDHKVSFVVTHSWNRPIIYESISGTAAKLGQSTAYHHCTLLVNVDKTYLSSVLEKKETGIVTNATASVSSSIKNLYDINRSIQMDNLLSAIGWEYLYTKPFHLHEDQRYNVNEQLRGFQYVNPTENWFPGINEFVETFRSWKWIFGKTPKFTVTRTFDVTTQDDKTHRVTLNLEVESSIVQEIRMSLPTELASTNFEQDVNAINNLRGTKYSHEVIENIIATIGGKTVMLDTRDKSADEARLDTITLQ